MPGYLKPSREALLSIALASAADTTLALSPRTRIPLCMCGLEKKNHISHFALCNGVVQERLHTDLQAFFSLQSAAFNFLSPRAVSSASEGRGHDFSNQECGSGEMLEKGRQATRVARRVGKAARLCNGKEEALPLMDVPPASKSGESV